MAVVGLAPYSTALLSERDDRAWPVRRSMERLDRR
jgi:hypothetical protein